MTVSCPTWEVSYTATILFGLQYDRHAEILIIQLWCIWCYGQLVQFSKLRRHDMALTLKLHLKSDLMVCSICSMWKVYYNLISAPSLVIRILNPLHMAVLDPGQHLNRSPYFHREHRTATFTVHTMKAYRAVGVYSGMCFTASWSGMPIQADLVTKYNSSNKQRRVWFIALWLSFKKQRLTDGV
jgi:hypothetical protein